MLLAIVKNRNGPSQQKTERCGTELYLSIVAVCVVATILKRLSSNYGQKSAKIFLIITLAYVAFTLTSEGGVFVGLVVAK